MADVVERVRETGRGNVVFVVGQADCGRSLWFEAAIHGVGRARVVAGEFLAGRYVARPASHPTEATAEVSALVGSIAGLSALLGPIGTLVGQLVAISAASVPLIERLRERPETDALDLIPRLLRLVAAENPKKPLVCFVNGAEHAEGNWWANLLLSFAQEVTEELPLVLVMGLDGQPEPSNVPTVEESPAYGVARSLRTRGLAVWWPLRPLSKEEVRAWLSPASVGLISAMWDITEGDPAEIAEVWESWAQRGVIRQDERGSWEMYGDAERSLAEAADRLNAQLSGLLGGSDVGSIAEVRAILACGALEGTIFTPEAVAQALASTPDRVIDLLDDHLTSETGPVHEAPPAAIVQPDGQERLVWRYRFARNLDRRIARVRFATEAERKELADRLAPALAASYAPEEHRVATALAALYGLAGNVAIAQHYRRIADFGMTQALLRAQARYLMNASMRNWTGWEVGRTAELLLAASNRLYGVVPYSESLEYATASAELARTAAMPLIEGHSLCWQAHLNLRMGSSELARRDLERARALFAGEAPRELQARIELMDARIEFADKKFETARAPAERAGAIYERLRQPDGAAASWYLLANIALELGDLESARHTSQRALEIHQSIDDRHDLAASWHQLAEIELRTGNLATARAANAHALKIDQEIGNRASEAATWLQLGQIRLAEGDFDEALAPVRRAVELHQDVGNRPSEAGAWLQLAAIELARGEIEGARRAAEEGVRIDDELGDRGGQAQGWYLLARIAVNAGDAGAAQTTVDRAVLMYRALGSRAGEAAAMRLLEEG